MHFFTWNKKNNAFMRNIPKIKATCSFILRIRYYLRISKCCSYFLHLFYLSLVHNYTNLVRYSLEKKKSIQRKSQACHWICDENS